MPPKTATLTGRVRKLLETEQKPMSISDVATRLRADSTKVGFVLADLTKREQVTRVKPGVYRTRGGARGGTSVAAKKTSPRKTVAKRRARRAPVKKAMPRKATVTTRARAQSGGGLRPVGTLRDGRTLLEDAQGTLWEARRLS